MTNEEAIKHGEQHQNFIVLALEAIKKRTPRMVRYESDGFADGAPVYDCAYCPDCEHDFYMDEPAVWDMPYCPNCGQALQWEGDEE